MINIKKTITLIIGVMIIGVFLTQTRLGHLLILGDVDAIAQYIDSFGSIAIILAFLFIMAQAFFPFVPFIVLAGVSVLLFGLWGGFLLSWLATSTGAVFAFLSARYIARGWAERKLIEKPIVQKFNTFIAKKGFLTIFLFRVSMIVPSSVINLAAALSTIRPKLFILATFLGNLPITFAESWLGHYFISLERQNGNFLIIIAIISLLIYIYRKVKRPKKI